MTIEIVDEKPDPKVQKDIVCKNCGVLLRYVPCDVKVRYYCKYDGDSDNDAYIDFPKCKVKVIVRR